MTATEGSVDKGDGQRRTTIFDTKLMTTLIDEFENMYELKRI